MDVNPAGLPQWMRELYSFRLGSVAVGTERMSYAEEGSQDSPPVVLVHGNAAWSFLWRKVIPEVARRFHVLAPDNIGFGLSSKPKDSGYHTLDRHIENLTALIESTGLKQVTLVGNGSGGPIVLGYAIRHPENVPRIVLVNSGVFLSSAAKKPWPVRLAAYSLGRQLLLHTDAVISPGLRMLAHRPLTKQARLAYAYPFPTAGERKALLAFASMGDAEPGSRDYETLESVAASLGSLQTRVEIVWGTQDRLLRGKVLPYLLRDAFRNAGDPKLLPGAGHLVAEDEPAAIAETLLEIFKPKPAAPVFNILR